MVNSDAVGSAPRMDALVASARRLTGTGLRDGRWKAVTRSGGSASSATQESDAGWQADAWDMYDLVGELRFIANTLANRLGKARLFVGRRNPADIQDIVRVEEDDPAFEALTAPLDSLVSAAGGGDGIEQLLSRIAVNLFVSGECWVSGVPRRFLPTPAEGMSGPSAEYLSPDGQPGGEILAWHTHSVDEVSTSGDRTVKLEIDSVDGTVLEVDPDELYLIRVWRPHPRKWRQADSPTRGNLPVLKELVGLTQHVSAQVDSRLAGAGILVIPQSVRQAMAAAAGPEVDADEDTFTEALLEAMLAPINDRGNASAIVPLVISAPDESVAGFRHISFSQPLDGEARALREEALRRLALGLDAPPELLLGSSGMNHWGSWLVQAETVESHLEPPLALICDALTTQYYGPALRSTDGLPAGVDPSEYVIGYDVEHLISRPNHGADARELYDRHELSAEALRRESGFDDGDEPEVDEKARRMVLGMVTATPALAAAPGIPALIEQVLALLEGRPVAPLDTAQLSEETAPGAAEGAPQPPVSEGTPGEGPQGQDGQPGLPATDENAPVVGG